MDASRRRQVVGGMLMVTALGVPVALAAPEPPPNAPAAVTALLSAAPDGAPGNADSFDPALSADGSTVAFASLATNLAARDAAGVVNVFMRDRRTGHTARISNGPDGMAGDGDSSSPALSGDGAVIAFDSFAGNLTAGDTNTVSDVFVYDRASGRTARVSVDSDGGQGNGDSSSPTLSADGRFVAFASDATALVPGDHNRAGDVFVRDREAGKTTVVSVASDGRPANGDSFNPQISADGRFVAFASEATNLVRGDTNGAVDIFVHDRETGHTNRVSVASDGGQVNGDAYSPTISGDGRYVAFATAASNVADADGNRASDVFVHDRRTGRTVLASAGPDGRVAERGSSTPVLSASGRGVAFVTDAALVAADTNGTEDVYVFDIPAGTVRRVSVASDGRQGDHPSTGPSISADAATLVFESLATNLVPADSNGAEDVFWRN
jgi:Tol biopolymer transport system component